MKKTGAERNHSPALQYQGPVLFVSLFVSLINAQSITLTLVKDTVLPVKGSSFGMSCNLSVSFNNNGITVHKNGTEKGTCLGSSHNCIIKPGTGIILKANLTGVFITISSLDRDSHEGTWTCAYSVGTSNINSNAVNLIVYTIPLGLSFTQVPNMNVDLSVTSAQLQCTTSGCTYPPPLIQWLIQGQTGSSPYEVYKTVNPIGTGGSCVSLEQLYTSTLYLQQNTTLDDNSDKVSIFSCRIEYPDYSMNLFTSGSQTIRFAIRLTEVFLQQNNQNITSTLTVTSGEQITLTCVTGTSRPVPNIDWYIGSRSMGSGTSLIFTPSITDHNTVIFCQAYNINPNLKVESNKPNLFVGAAPKILDVSPSYKGYVGQYTIIQFDFYTNTDENLTVTARHSNSSGLIHQGIILPILPDDLQVYSSQITAPVFRATLAISITRKNDFGQYDMEVKNSIGSDSKSIRIIEQITPEKPLNFHATNIQEKQLSLTWQSGYHGGFIQTFVVEISLDNITWNNVSQVSDGNRDGWFSTVIEDLIPGSEYYLRLYAYNIYGRGDFADVQLVIRMLKERASASSLEVSASVGIGVGGIVLGLIGTIFAFTIQRKLNGPKKSYFRSKGKTDDTMHTYSNTEMNPETVKPIYEELNKGNVERTVYDKISPL